MTKVRPLVHLWCCGNW